MTSKTQPISLLRILILLLISLCLAVLIYKIWDSDYVYAHRKYFLSNDIIYLNFNKLEPISVEQVKNNYHLNWWCNADNTLPDFGDYVCSDELKGWDNIPAMFVAFWFKDGKLNNAKIDIPYWHHAKVIEKIRNEYGEPIQKSHRISYVNVAKKLGLLVITKGKYTGEDDINIDGLGVWKLKSGAWIVTEIKPGGNIFSWNSIFWINPQDAKKLEHN